MKGERADTKIGFMARCNNYSAKNFIYSFQRHQIIKLPSFASET